MRYALPGAVKAAAIICITIGSLLIFAWLSSRLLDFLHAVGGDHNGPGDLIERKLEEIRTRDVPGYRAVVAVSIALGLVKSLALLISGFGQLGMRVWARIFGVLGAFVSLISFLLEGIYYFAYVYPASKKAFAGMPEFLAEKGAALPGPDFVEMAEFMTFSVDIGAAVISLVLIIPLGIVVTLLMLPSVGRAFANPLPAHKVERLRNIADDLDYEQGRYDDDDYDDRRNGWS